MEHEHHHHAHSQHVHQQSKPDENIFALATSATLHCLLGCGIGEVVGMIFSTWLGLSMISSMVLSILLGFVAGLALGVLPLLRRNIPFSNAFKLVVVGEGLSIGVMEAFEIATQLIIPGVMLASLTDAKFWLGMAASLVVGFIAALPVNYVMIKRGVRHIH